MSAARCDQRLDLSAIHMQLQVAAPVWQHVVLKRPDLSRHVRVVLLMPLS
jgi:hypothetical protein